MKKQITHSKKEYLQLAAVLMMLLFTFMRTPISIFAVGETSTRFGMFIPPNGNNSGRDPALIVTAVQDNTIIDIIDDNADGDDDDSATGLTLNTGQSHIIYIQEGAVNDDLGGKQDGDYFLITASKPIIVANLTVNTDWQHDFVPADNRLMSGTSFYLYRPHGFSQTHGRNELVNIFAYNDNTDIQVIDITDTAKTSSGTTSVVSDADGSVIFSTTLNAGEDLQEVHDFTMQLDAGRTFHIVSNKDVTVQFGALSKGQTGSRDGGTYVPGKNGTSADKTFYFTIPYKYSNEREMRIVSYDQPADITIRGWNTSSDQWDTIQTLHLAKYGHVELVGNTDLGSNYYFFEVTADATISIFETNWLETGSFGTSDIVTFISSSEGIGAGESFLAYLGPPALELGQQLSHLYVYAYQSVNGIAYDPDSYGEYIELYNNSGQTIDLGGWTLTNNEGWAITIPDGLTVRNNKTFLLEFHTEATDKTANYVYGDNYPKFKLGNGSDTLTLRNADGNVVDTLSYSDSGWGSHGVYKALERVNPNQPFTAGNAQDSSSYQGKTSGNLGAYYGTPGIHQGSAGNGKSTLIINEVMNGRIYQSFTIDANRYYDVALTVEEWKSIRNGDNPNSGDGPENPYLIVETDGPVSVMNANWNDNWFAYGTGTLQPDPTVNHTANYYERKAGESVVFSTYVSNDFNTLFSPVTTIHLPIGINYTQGSYTTPTQISSVTPTETQNGDGSWTLTWTHDKELNTGDVYFFQITGTINGALGHDNLLQSTAITVGQDTIGGDYSSQDSAVVNVGIEDESTIVNDIVINEVLPNPGCGTEWIEIHNLSTNDVNIGGWELADEDGFIYRFPDLTFIPNDGYLTLYLGSGVADNLNLFTGEAYAGALGDSEDQVSLYNSSTHDVSTLVDFVQWGSSSLADGADDDLAVAAGQWSSGVFVNAPVQDQSIGRDRNATDSNGPIDWDNSGGDDSAIPSQGTINVSIPGADAIPPAAVSVVSATAVPGQEGNVTIDWRNPADGDLAGVKVIRALDTHPDALNDGVIIYDGIAGTVTDTGLTPGKPVYYTLFAYDDAGNISCAHTGAPTQALPPQDVYIAFEDLKANGWVDWDMNDFVVKQTTAVQLTDDGNVSQLDITFEPVARGGLFDHKFYLSIDFNGYAHITVDQYSSNGTLQSSNASSSSNGAELVIFESTKDVLPPNHNNGTTNAVSGSGTAKSPTVSVSIELSNPANNPLETLHTPPFDPWIRNLNNHVSIHLVQSGEVGNTQRVWYSGGPLNGRDLPFGLVFDEAWVWPEESTPIWDAYPNFDDFVISGETEHTDWFNYPSTQDIWSSSGFNFLNFVNIQQPVQAKSTLVTQNDQTGWPQSTSGLIFGSPLIVDIDGDNDNELIVTSQDFNMYAWEADGTAVSGWPRNLGAFVRSSPAVGDIDGNGDMELVVGTDNGKLHAYHHNGTAVSGFPISLGGSIHASPVLANLDSDSALEIVVSNSNGELHIRNGNGSNFSTQWPQTMAASGDSYGSLIIASSPAVGDMDGDGTLEIVSGSTDGNVYAWHLDGSPVSVLWPQQTGDWVYGAPVIVDLNEDGYRDVIAVSGDGKVYAWRGEGTSLPGFPVDLQSPMLASPAITDLDGDGDLEIAATTLDGTVHVLQDDGTAVFNWPRTVNAQTYASPVIGDIDGDGDMELLQGSQDGNVYAWHHDGIPMIDWPKQTGDWIVSTPTLGDLDKDGDIEVAVGSFDKKLYVWDEAGSYNPDNIGWAAFGGSNERTGFVDTNKPIQQLPDVVFTIYLPMVTSDQ